MDHFSVREEKIGKVRDKQLRASTKESHKKNVVHFNRNL